MEGICGLRDVRIGFLGLGFGVWGLGGLEWLEGSPKLQVSGIEAGYLLPGFR